MEFAEFYNGFRRLAGMISSVARGARAGKNEATPVYEAAQNTNAV